MLRIESYQWSSDGPQSRVWLLRPEAIHAMELFPPAYYADGTLLQPERLAVYLPGLIHPVEVRDPASMARLLALAER